MHVPTHVHIRIVVQLVCFPEPCTSVHAWSDHCALYDANRSLLLLPLSLLIAPNPLPELTRQTLIHMIHNLRTDLNVTATACENDICSRLFGLSLIHI